VADEVWGEANGQLSLTQARKNYRECGAYDPIIGRDPVGGGVKPKEKPEQPGSGFSAEAPRKRRKPKPAPKPVSEAAATEKTEEKSYGELLKSLPPELASEFSPGPPRPSWLRAISSERLARYALPLLVVFLVALCIHQFGSGWFSSEKRDRGYSFWTQGEGEYQPKYLEAFARDRWFQHRLVGQRFESLRQFFPEFGDGDAPDNPDQLRTLNPGHIFPPTPAGSRLGSYWLDGAQRGRTYCALVQDGKIVDFCFAERRKEEATSGNTGDNARQTHDPSPGHVIAAPSKP
jgi:hypothetical protein